MISKENFCKLMDTIEKTIKFDDDVTKLFRKYNTEWDYLPFTNEPLFNVVLTVLTEEMDDKDETIYWWIFDTGFGKDPDLVPVIRIDENTQYIVKTAANLYDFLTGEYKY